MDTPRTEIIHQREPAIPLGLTLAEYVTGYAEAIGAAANRLARSFLLPDALRIGPNDAPDVRESKTRDVGVLLARALSTREDIMALAQSIYMVGGRPALASAYLVARAQQVGAIRGAPRYRTDGIWPEISVTASVATPDGETHEATVSMQEAREDGWAGRNPKYKSHRPAENMLCHRAAARLIRRVAPGVVLGMAVAEEAMDQPIGEIAAVVATESAATRPAGRAALGLERPAAPETRALPDHGGQPVPDYAEESARLAEREAVEVVVPPAESAPVEVIPPSARPAPTRGGRPGGFGGGR